MNLSYLIFSLLFLLAPARPQETYQVDTEASTVRWVGKKILGEHYGTLQLHEGMVMLEEGKLQGGNFTIDMRTLVNQDLEGGQREKLEDWLRSKEMFYVERYPFVVFEITSVQSLDENQQYQLEGELIIKGVSHRISFPANVRKEGKTFMAEAELIFDRTRWNLNYGSGGVIGGLGNFAIEDEVSVQISLQANAAIQ